MKLFEQFEVLRRSCELLERLVPSHLAAFDNERFGLVFESTEQFFMQTSGASELAAAADELRKLCVLLDAEPGDTEAFMHLFAQLRCLDVRLGLAPLRAVSVETRILLVGQRFWRAYATRYGVEAHTVPVLAELPLINIRIADAPAPVGLSHGSLARFERARRSGRLRIGLAGLQVDTMTQFAPTRITDPDPARRVQGFRSAMVQRPSPGGATEEAYLAELDGVATRAIDEGVDILVLPELCVCDAGVARLVAALRGAKEPPSLVVAGSFHRDDAGFTQNRAPVLTWDAGAATYRDAIWCDKANPWADDIGRVSASDGLASVIAAATQHGAGRLREDIDLTPVKRLVAVKTDLGVFGVAICLDAMDPAVMARYRGVADHLLLISMNSSDAAEFYSRARSLAASQWMSTFYINATRAIHGPKPVDGAFWQLPLVPTRVTRKTRRVQYVPPGASASSGKVIVLPHDAWTVCELPTRYELWQD